MNKRAIELAAGFIVVLIISIILFGLASALTYKIFCASENKIQQLDADSQKRVEQLLSSGATVNIPDASKTVKSVASFCGGSRTALASFLLGIRNDFSQPQVFTVRCAYNGMVGPDDRVIPPQAPYMTCEDWDWKMTDSTLTVGAKDKESKVMLFGNAPNAKPGKHIFTISVLYDGFDAEGNPVPDMLYGAKKIYLTLE